jgi:hypothetical protein
MDGADKAAVTRAIQQLADENGGVPVGKERFVAETGLADYLFQGRLWPPGATPSARQGTNRTLSV